MNKEKKEKLILMSIAAILVVVAISTFSLAALKKKINGSSGKVVYQAGDLDVVLDETGSTDIAITTAIPTKDSDGQAQTPYKFSIKNNGTAALSYEIYLDNDTDAQASCTKTKGSTCALLSDSDIRYEIKKDTASVKTLTSTRLLGSGTVDASSSDSYELKVWLNYNATNSAMGKYFFGKVRVVVSQIKSQGSKMTSSVAFNRFEGIAKVTSIVTKDDNEIPSTALQSWDESENGDGSVVAYIEDDGSSSNTFKLTIGGTGGIIAPEDMSSFFQGLNVVSIDLSFLDTSSVTDMNYMFAECQNLVSLDLSGFNTSNVSYMSFMFYGCYALESLDVSNFDTSNVLAMDDMFCYCGTLTSLDLTSFVPEKVTTMSEMFKGTSNLGEIIVNCDMLMNNPDTTDMFKDSACNDFTKV